MLCCVLSIVSLECPLQLLLWVDWQMGRLESIRMFLTSESTPPKANVSGLITICCFSVVLTVILHYDTKTQLLPMYICN